MNNIGEKIRQKREELNISQEKLSDLVGISPKTLQRIEKGESDIKVGLLKKISEALKTNFHELIGIEPINIQKNKAKEIGTLAQSMTINSHIAQTGIKNKITKTKQPQVFDEENGIEVTYYPDVYAAAGYGATNTLIEPKKVKLAEFILDFFGIRDYKKAEILNVLGDSMEPVFQNGDLAIVERVSSFDEVKNGDTIIINIDGDVYIKKIEKVPFENKIILKSNNPLYKDIIIDIDDTNNVEIVAIVKGKFRLI